MTKQPFMPVFFAEILSATPYWRGEERALYLLLLGYQWVNGPLPADLDELAQSVQYESKPFIRLWKKVGQRFAQTPDGWVNLLLEERRAKSKEISAIRSALGTRGGEASAAKRKAIATAKAQATATTKGAANVIPIASAIAAPNAAATGVANGQAKPEANGQAKFNHLKKEEKNEEEESEASQGKKGS